ncbi:SseB family protein [Leucobacter sp. CSA1]|uniref:SseB family protein n=1 Tax=Leucobacter chromiisoli TaxID=2796471 RepID=A0A934UVS8_9MICO|nr:SseB family protein [Leucobacter chromiisoli]MBK0419811.1 SseB family protein [Leucobacter chromiisoli]
MAQANGANASNKADHPNGADATHGAESPDAPAPGVPEDLSADYENVAALEALEALQATPDHEHLAAFLTALRSGYLVVDVTGAPAKGRKKGTRIRTIRSTKGQLVLPLFTSMAKLRAAVTDTRADQVKGAMMPASEALKLIGTDRFVAAEIDKASPSSLVVLRKYVALAAGDEEITPELLQSMR